MKYAMSAHWWGETIKKEETILFYLDLFELAKNFSQMTIPPTKGGTIQKDQQYHLLNFNSLTQITFPLLMKLTENISEV